MEDSRRESVLDDAPRSTRTVSLQSKHNKFTQEDVENRVHPHGGEPSPDKKQYSSETGLKEEKSMGKIDDIEVSS